MAQKEGRLARLKALLEEFYVSPYRGAIARARREEDDLFMLFVFSELMGVPNPAAYYTLELQPLLLERFHDWHRRQGLQHSPLDGFRCCCGFLARRPPGRRCFLGHRPPACSLVAPARRTPRQETTSDQSGQHGVQIAYS